MSLSVESAEGQGAEQPRRWGVSVGGKGGQGPPRLVEETYAHPPQETPSAAPTAFWALEAVGHHHETVTAQKALAFTPQLRGAQGGCVNKSRSLPHIPKCLLEWEAKWEVQLPRGSHTKPSLCRPRPLARVWRPGLHVTLTSPATSTRPQPSVSCFIWKCVEWTPHKGLAGKMAPSCDTGQGALPGGLMTLSCPLWEDGF